MTIHVSVDTGCNLSCDYCYEEKDRAINGNDVKSNYDIDAIIERLEDWKHKYPNEPPGFHGGEPLLIRREDMEEVYQWIWDNYESVRTGEKYTHIQTNGTLIDDEDIEMFKKFNVSVGISCDGPPELNTARSAALNEAATDNLSQITYDNIFKLADEGVPVGVITVLHKVNAGDDEKLNILLNWMDELNQRGIDGHFNESIPYDDIQTDLTLSTERLKEVYIQTWEWMNEAGHSYRTWNPMRDYQDNLLGNNLTDCRNNKCDVFNAGAAKIVDGDGETTGCGKTWEAVSDGTPFLQGDSNGSEYSEKEHRYEMLKQTPGAPETEGPDHGGCEGCRYWSVCTGGCPSAGMEQDYRNRTRFCEAKYYLYKRIEEDMRQMFPNIRLITELPWDSEIEDLSTDFQADIKPWVNMDPGVEGESTVRGRAEHQFGSVMDTVPKKILPERTNEEIIQEWEERHGEENVEAEIEGEELNIHADSNHE